jgi:DNA-binding PadR family transcriptional regulator
MLELAILGLLQGQELHGYEIRRRLRDDLGVLANVSFGSLYPALSRLERAGAVVAVDAEDLRDEPVPMTGSLSGERAAFRARRPTVSRGRRGRKVYRITETGRRQFAELLAADPAASDDGRGFGLRLAFFRYLPPSARLALLERRRSLLADRLRSARRATTGPGGDHYTRALVEHVADTVERDIAWIDQLIAAERARQADGATAGRTAPDGPEVGATLGEGGSRSPTADLSPGLVPASPDPTAAAVHVKGTPT